MINQLAERRPVATLILLLLLQVAMLTYQVRTPKGQRLIHHWSLAAFTPVAAALDGLVEGIRDGGKLVWGFWQAHSEKIRLQDENARLRLEVARLQGLQSMLPRLEAYQPLLRSFDSGLILGSVIWNSPQYFEHSIVVNAGSRHGITRELAVVSPLGVVGRVLDAAPFSSSVELITNPDASAGVLVGEERWPGILSGDGSSLLKLGFISNSKGVKIGDAVVASGTDRIYPKGFPVGEVVHSEPGPMGQLLFRVRPAADLIRLEEVAIILPPAQDQGQGSSAQTGGS